MIDTVVGTDVGRSDFGSFNGDATARLGDRLLSALHCLDLFRLEVLRLDLG